MTLPTGPAAAPRRQHLSSMRWLSSAAPRSPHGSAEGASQGTKRLHLLLFISAQDVAHSRPAATVDRPSSTFRPATPFFHFGGITEGLEDRPLPAEKSLLVTVRALASWLQGRREDCSIESQTQSPGRLSLDHASMLASRRRAGGAFDPSRLGPRTCPDQDGFGFAVEWDSCSLTFTAFPGYDDAITDAESLASLRPVASGSGTTHLPPIRTRTC